MVGWLSRRSYMSANVLFNLLNEFRKNNKMRGLLSILLLFCNEFNKFNNTGARMLYSIYHMTLKLINNPFLACQSQEIAIFYATL